MGAGFGCAVASGGAQCWGKNGGALGNGATVNSSLPVPVTGLATGVRSMSAGNSYACAVLSDSSLDCWGNDFFAYGVLGNGSTTSTLVPAPVTGLIGSVTSVSTGTFTACAVTTGGAVECWGYNGYGLLGDPTITSSPVPVPLAGLANGVTSVSVGMQSACAITTGGGLVCWGDNTYGELGNGLTTSSTVPVPVTGLGSGVLAVSVGSYSACAVTAGGAVQCWGASGALGSSAAPTLCLFPGDSGSGTFCSTVPEPVTGLTSGATGVSVSDRDACAVTAGGGVQCWGIDDSAYGILGDGTGASSVTPVQVSGLTSGVTAVSVWGDPSACALTASGGVRCWGDNRYGELGNGSLQNSSVPVAVECGGISCN
jgi:alpha-tubulin suppressor-like RCC1 family protein